MNAPAPAPAPGRQELYANIRRAILELDWAVAELLESRWREPERRHAAGLAAAIAEACKTPDLRHVGTVARAAASLLRLRTQDVLDVEDQVREKLADLVELLKETGNAETQSA